jgi:hypothetical protein
MEIYVRQSPLQRTDAKKIAPFSLPRERMTMDGRMVYNFRTYFILWEEPHG